jgi:hypothetical protein
MICEICGPSLIFYAGLGLSPTPSGTLCLLANGAGPQFQCPSAANCFSAGSGQWSSATGTLLLTVRFGGFLDASNDTKISFRLLNPTTPTGGSASAVGIRAQYLSTSQWTSITLLSGSVLRGGDTPQFLACLASESRLNLSNTS